jgi:HK97 family phage portal protein
MEPQQGGNGRRSIAVLNATTEFHALTWSPIDAALADAISANLIELANAFGVPPYMIGAPTDANTYANIESRRMDFVTFTLQPWSARIEATLDAQLPRGTSLKVNLDALLRADTMTRTTAEGVMIDKGIRTVTEVRELEDLPPLDEELPAAPAAPAQLEVVA